MPKEQIEEPEIDPKEKVHRLVTKIDALDNTVQYSWLIEISREFFGFEDDRLTLDNWEGLYDSASEKMAQPDWEDQVLAQSNIETGLFDQ